MKDETQEEMYERVHREAVKKNLSLNSKIMLRCILLTAKEKGNKKKKELYVLQNKDLVPRYLTMWDNLIGSARVYTDEISAKYDLALTSFKPDPFTNLERGGVTPWWGSTRHFPEGRVRISEWLEREKTLALLDEMIPEEVNKLIRK